MTTPRTPDQAPPARTPRGAARNRALDTALSLFNEHGTAAVSTNRIAAAAGLSVGNLYYHFRNKEEVIRALYDRLAAESDAAFAVPPGAPLTADALERLLAAAGRLVGKYRFFYRELAALVRADPDLAARYRAVRERGFADFARLVDGFVAAGVFAPIPDPADVRRLAEACWLVTECYPPFAEAGGCPRPDPAAAAALRRLVLRPYLRGTPAPPTPPTGGRP